MSSSTSNGKTDSKRCRASSFAWAAFICCSVMVVLDISVRDGCGEEEDKKERENRNGLSRTIEKGEVEGSLFI